MLGEESVKEAISLLQNYKPIQNGEGNGYMMYFKFTKEFINNKFFDLFDTDFNTINSQLKKLKVDKYYELRCYNTFEGFTETTQEEIIYHIKEYTNSDGEYGFFTQYR
jgi:ATP-dependent RNA circularization protein (DNA/RNA ligase family)